MYSPQMVEELSDGVIVVAANTGHPFLLVAECNGGDTAVHNHLCDAGAHNRILYAGEISDNAVIGGKIRKGEDGILALVELRVMAPVAPAVKFGK